MTELDMARISIQRLVKMGSPETMESSSYEPPTNLRAYGLLFIIVVIIIFVCLFAGCIVLLVCLGCLSAPNCCGRDTRGSEMVESGVRM